MQAKCKYAALTAAMTLAWGIASARSTTSAERTDEYSRSLTYAAYLKGKDLRASELVGARVRNAQGDSFGEIEELVLPSPDQDDMLVIVSVGGVPGARHAACASHERPSACRAAEHDRGESVGRWRKPPRTLRAADRKVSE